MEHMSEYEQQRLDNIKRNQELLRSLDLQPLSNQIPTPKQKQKPKHKPEPRRKEDTEPRRTSARLRNLPAPDETTAKRQAEEDNSSQDATKKRRKEGDLILEGIETKLTSRGDNERFAKLLEDLRTPIARSTTAVIVIEDDDANDENARPVDSNNGRSRSIPLELKKEAQNLKIRHTWSTVKVVPERIYCSTFHPSADKLLGVAGDTTGNLGFWHVNGIKEPADVDDDDNEAEPSEPEPVVFAYRPHSRAITSIIYRPTDPSKVFTSSYDGSVRYFDMNKATFVEAFVAAKDRGEYAFTWIDFDPTGNQLFFCTEQGEIGFHDIRESLHASTVYDIIPSKTKCLHLNPANPNLLVTASNDKFARIWDVRKMRTSGGVQDAPSQLHQFEHGYSVTSAYWSPDGKRIVSTGYDDMVKIFAGDDQGKAWKMEAAIPHNNQTRKWVTMFRATWSANIVSPSSNALAHPYFCVGNMKHPVDIYSGVRGDMIAQLYDVDHITAVPAVVTFHPQTSSMTVLCGNASGRMVCWS